MIEGFDRAKCQRRNRLTAARGKVEGVPIRFLRGGDDEFVRAGTMVDAQGEIPASDDEALALINALRPASSRPLTLDEVYIHRIEAASGAFISDRFAFMGTSTLLNIAKGGAAGIAFMNSHRTGDMSTPSELPFGRTFAGRYEAKMGRGGRLQERALLGFYMLRGIQPNGANGPSSDDLHRMIDGGQLFDVSVGLAPGERGKAVCDVCGQDYRKCDHYAGTNHEMSMDEQQAQVARGVPGGQATYRLEDYEISEVSGVYDGAVPGAGFSKGLSMLDSLSDEERAQFREAFSSLLFDEEEAEPAPPSGTPPVFNPTISASGGLPGPAGTTSPKQSGTPSGTKPHMSFRQSLINAFGALGFGRFVSALNGTVSEDPELLANLLSGKVKEQSDDLVANHPIITLAKAHGIGDVDGFNVLLDRARNGDQYLSDLREEAKREANRAFGAASGPMVGAAVDTQSLFQVKISRDAWRKAADEKYGIGQNGEAPARQTVFGGAVAVDVDETPPPTRLWDRMDEADRVVAAKSCDLSTMAKQDAFAQALYAKSPEVFKEAS
ncbi:hypothetical protein EON79_03680 [bacterium]|nr:MAG: hypothetical protein EON79_03680 [bacterium]